MVESEVLGWWVSRREEGRESEMCANDRGMRDALDLRSHVEAHVGA